MIEIATTTSDAVKLTLNDGGRLTVNDGGNDVGFKVGDQTY